MTGRSDFGMVKRTVAVLFATLGLLARSAHSYQPLPLDVDAGPISISLGLPLAQAQPPSGFFPLHVKIGNDTRDPHRWTMKITNGGMGRGRSTGFRQEIAVGAGEVKEVDLLVPRAGLMTPSFSYENLAGEMQGPGISGAGIFHLMSRYSGGQSSAFVVFSESLGVRAWSKIESEIKSAGFWHGSGVLESSRLSPYRSGKGSVTRGLNGSQVKLAELPPDSRALSGVAGLWVSSDDWAGLNQPLRDAIRDWVTAGGNLYVACIGGTRHEFASLPAHLDFDNPQPLGFGTVKLVKLVGGELPATETVLEILALDNAPLPQWKEDFDQKWPLADFVGVPRLNVPLVITFVGCFALIIGPFNLLWLAPARRRHRLFVTVPLLSAGASMVLFLMIAVSDGFGGSGGRDALVLFSTGENRVSLIQEQVSRTRLLFNRSFSFPEEAAISAFFPKTPGERPGQIERTGGTLSGDWFRSRSTQIQVIRTTIPSRAEVRLQPSSGGAPVLLSSAATTMHHLFYVDQEKNYWAGEELTPGRPLTLRASSKTDFDKWRNASAADFTQNLRTVLDRAANRPGYFYADAEAMPEAPLATLRTVSWPRQTILCLGPCTPAAP